MCAWVAEAKVLTEPGITSSAASLLGLQLPQALLQSFAFVATVAFAHPVIDLIDLTFERRLAVLASSSVAVRDCALPTVAKAIITARAVR